MHYRDVTAQNKVLLVASALFTLSGCTGTTEPDDSFLLTGSVGDGPIIGADITVFDANGTALISGPSDSSARYVLDVPGDAAFPLTVEASGGMDLVTGVNSDFVLRTATFGPSQLVANVSPVSTIAVQTAVCMSGGLSAENIDFAIASMNSELSMGLDMARTGDPIFDPVDAGNIADVVLANEAIGETLRRSRDALAGTSSSFSLRDIIDQVACDLGDGQIDGVGPNVEKRVILTFIAASAGVMLETMAHQLRVNGSDATFAMDQSIIAVLPGEPFPPDVSSVQITAEFVHQAETAMHVARNIVTNVSLLNLIAILGATPVADLPEALRQALDAPTLNALDQAPGLAAMATDADISQTLAILGLVRDSNAPTLSFQATSDTVPAGSSVELVWSSIDTDRCVASGAWNGEQSISGTFSTQPIDSSAAFGLSCIGYGGAVTKQISVNVGASTDPPPPPVPPPSNGVEYARSVPYPDFGWDPLNYDPVTTSTVSALPSTMSAGEVLEYTGTSGGSVTLNCTAASPCVLRGQNQILSSSLNVTGSHFVVEHFKWFNGGGSVTVRDASFVVVRDNEHFGDNTGSSNGTSMTATYDTNLVYYRNTIRNLGIDDGTDEVDYHGFKPRHGNINVWYLDNDVYRLGGDSIQAGTNVSRMGGNPFSENIFIAKNRFHDNGENPIDIKAALHITISENSLYGAKLSSSSSGEVIVIHESGDDVYILSNAIYDSRRGVVTSTSGGGATYILVDGNTFQNLEQYGVYNRGGGHAEITNNLFINVPIPIQNNPNNGSTVTESGNTFQ